MLVIVIVVLVFVLVFLESCKVLKVKKINKENLKNLAIALLIAVVLSSLIAGIFAGISIRDNHLWNNGSCPNCDTPWELFDVEYTQNQIAFYYYQCDECGDLIKTMKNFK